MSVIVKVMAYSNGRGSPHDGRYVVHWNPHTRFGVCEVHTTGNRALAHRFADYEAVMRDWKTVSDVQPTRPDGEPNRPLTALIIESERESGGLPT